MDFSTNTPIYQTPCQICGSLDHQTDYCQGGRRRESEDPSSPSSGEDETSRRRCLNCTNEHPGECPCRWCNQPGHISSQCTARHDSEVMRQRFPKRVQRKKPTVGGYQCWKCSQYHSFREYCPNIPYPRPRLGEYKACGCIDGQHVEGCDYDAIPRRLLLCTYCGKAGHIHQDCQQRQREPQRRETPYQGRPNRGRDIEYESSPQREEEYPRWTPPTLGFDILNRNQPPMMVRPAPTVTQTVCKQVHIKEEPEVSPPRRESKMFFLWGRNTLLPDLPGAEANGPRASK